MKETDNWEEAKEHLEKYVLVQWELLKLHLVEKYAHISSSVFGSFLLFIVLIMVVMFASIGAALAIGDEIQHPYLGFLVVAGFYLLLFLVLYLFCRKSMRRLIMSFIIKKIYHNDD